MTSRLAVSHAGVAMLPTSEGTSRFMTGQSQRLCRRFSSLETWAFGFTVMHFWLAVASEVHLLLDLGAFLLWGPATL